MSVWLLRRVWKLNRDELKRSTTSSLLSPPASPLRILQWVAMMPTPTILLCVDTSVLGTTYGYCECRATFVPFQVGVDYHLIKSPNVNFGAGTQVPPLVLHLADNPIIVRISFVRFLLILFPPQSVKTSRCRLRMSGFGITFGSLSLLPFTASYSNDETQ